MKKMKIKKNLLNFLIQSTISDLEYYFSQFNDSFIHLYRCTAAADVCVFFYITWQSRVLTHLKKEYTSSQSEDLVKTLKLYDLNLLDWKHRKKFPAEIVEMQECYQILKQAAQILSGESKYR